MIRLQLLKGSRFELLGLVLGEIICVLCVTADRQDVKLGFGSEKCCEAGRGSRSALCCQSLSAEGRLLISELMTCRLLWCSASSPQ